MALVIAIAPLNVKFEKGFHIEQSKACAATPVADAVGFIETAAQQTTLSSAEFVATVAGIVASSGFNISATSSITMGNTLSQNLAAIAPTSDYPAWSSLSSSEQNSWTSEDNYNAARFNSLMGAFDIDVDSYYSGGGGSHSFAPGELDLLSDISDIGQDWIDGVGILYSTVFGTIQDEEAIYKYFGQVDYSIVDGSNDPNWPSGVPTTIYVYSGTYLAIKAASSSYWFFQPGCYYYVIMNESGNNFCCDMFSKTQTKYASKSVEGDIPTQSNYRDLPTSTYNGNRYWHNFGTYLSGSNLRFDGVAPSPTPISNMNNASNLAAYLLFNDLVSEPEQVQPNITDYPGETNIDNSINIYFPSGGLTEDTPWDDFLTYQEEITEDLSGIITLLRHIDSDLHNFEFTSLGNLKVYDGVVADILDNMYQRIVNIETLLGKLTMPSNADQIIGNFDFDDIEAKVPDLLDTISELAPFGALALLSEIFAIVSEVNVVDNPELVFPFQFGGYTDDGLEVVVDLSWMDDLKPAINFFTILMLVLGLTYATIRVVQMEAAP